MTAKGNPMREGFHQERKKAEERIHRTPDGVVGWIIRFLQTDLEALTPSEWTVLSFEVASFVHDIGDRYGGFVATESGWAVEAVPHGDVHERLPSRQEALTLQQSLLAQLDAYWKTAHAVFTFPQLTLIVTPPGAFHDNKGTVVVAAKRKIKEFEYRFAHLLAESGQYIRRCPECSRIYLAIRCDQLYCHPRCQARVASRKWRGKQTMKNRDTAPSGRSPKGGSHGKATR
jgi:hypothetical protein